ncbi:MAG TPA: DUF72 domain-containing protein [Bacteroidia bacterium]|nr:DUF72 domain-containing protein [Bacteroidia bacterium]
MAELRNMKFGKLGDIGQVDFTLPPDPERTLRVLARAAKSTDSQSKIMLGATGWGNQEWQGKWYPAKAKPIDYLGHYSLLFNTIELNTTHYRIPDADTVDRWRREAAPGFAFCPKVPQQISHRSKLRAEEPTLRFAEVVAGLGDKLGPCFIQLPDHHSPAELQLIRDYLRMWPSEAALHWELRHPGWFAQMANALEDGLDALEAAGHGTVITDVAGRRDVLHMALTTPVLMLRFVGNGLHPTDYDRSDAWIARITDWIKKGLQAAYIFIHQPDMELVPDFTAYWAKALNQNLGLRIPVPKPISMPIQGSLF